jgi:hypothetical protein
MKRQMLRLGFLVLGPVMALPGFAAELSSEQLAKIAQNPIANLVSVPIENDVNLNYGPLKKTQDVLQFKPVIPIELNKDWNVITRTILPIISQPALTPDESRTSGIGATQFSAFLSPADDQGTLWGVGPIAQLPTTSSSKLGSYRWGLGPTFVALHTEKGDPWVYGALVNNVWSVGSGGGGGYNQFLMQPFVNYNFRDAPGTYFSSSPIITANWKAHGSNVWTLPVGGALGHIFHLGRLPVNTQIGAYYNAVRPDFASNWQVRAEATFMFPK